jgi:hypothetical protein
MARPSGPGARGGTAAALAALVMLAAAGPAVAGQARINPDRPDRANSPDTIEPGMAQLESGLVFLRDASGDRPVRRLRLETSFRLGITETLEFDLLGDVFVRERGEGQGTSGIGDTVLAAKWRLFDAEGWRPGFGLSPFVKLPTASRSKDLGSGRVDFGGTLLAGQSLPADFHLDLNVGLAALSLAERPKGLFLQKSAAASFSWVGSNRITPFWEIFYGSRDHPAGRHGMGTDFGLIYMLHDRVAVDVAGEVGLAGNAADWAVRAGFSLLLGALESGGSQAGRRRSWPGAVAGAVDTPGSRASHRRMQLPGGGEGRP